MEGHVNAGKRNGGEAALEGDVTLLLLLLLRLGMARGDDLPKHLLDLIDGELLRELCDASVSDHTREQSTCLRDIDLLHLQVVKNVGERLQRHELPGTDVLLTLP